MSTGCCINASPSSHKLPLRSLDQISLQSKLREIGRRAAASAQATEPN
jgi:hypothetical protein